MTEPNIVERARIIRAKGRPNFGSALYQTNLDVFNWAGEVLAAYEIGRNEDEDAQPYKDALHDLVMLRAQDDIGCVPAPNKEQWANAWRNAEELFEP